MHSTQQKRPAPPSTDSVFVISRTLHAPRASVFNAWINAKKMAEWWGPKMFTNPVCRLDPRSGGAFRIVMRAPDGSEYPFKGVFREVTPPARLVYTNDTSEHGKAWHDVVNQYRPHANGKNIDSMITTVTFDERGGKTEMEIRMGFESAEDRDALVKIGMEEGWSGSLEKLDTLLEKAEIGDAR